MQISKSIQKVIMFSFVLVFSFGLFPGAHAAVPKLLTYQGILKDNSGNYLTGTYSMIFKIYTVSSGGSAAWTETQSSVSVSSGKFSVQLGSVTALNLDFNSDYWLGITVGADAEMTPRVQLTSAGYTIRADYENNGFTQGAHDALTHKNVEGVKDNTVIIGRTNFKLDAYSTAAANSMGDMVIDVFNDASGISSGSSTGYTWRGSSNFDVIATPAGGNDGDVKLLLHGNGTDASTSFTDSSSGSKTVTASGNAQIDTAQSKFGGASMLFDGSGDYLSVPDSGDWDWGTGDFAVDFWVRFNSVANAVTFVDRNAQGQTIRWAQSVNQLRVDLPGTPNALTASWTPSTNTWYHVAVTRSGTSLRAFIDGTQIGSTATDSTDVQLNNESLYIGDQEGGGTSLNGWMDELRVSKGVARWTSNFTPPSAEYSAAGGTATVISNSYSESVAPTEAIVMADETLNGDTITYHISRDNGTTWTQCTKETVCNISSQPSGTQLKWKAVITDEAELNAIAVAV